MGLGLAVAPMHEAGVAHGALNRNTILVDDHMNPTVLASGLGAVRPEASSRADVASVIEIIAGIGVALRPRVFSYVVAAWLAGIFLNLLLFPPSHAFPHFDVALRDLGLCLGALALGRLSSRVVRE